MEQHWLFTRHKNPYIYIPNLIGRSHAQAQEIAEPVISTAEGYVRIASSLTAFAVALWSPKACILLYTFGFICDELDGRFARMFGQTTMLGQVLDMVTDRLSTAGLLVVLSILNQKWYFCFLVLLMLDIFSHWFQMYATLAAGAATHKDTESQSPVVRFYYQHRLFMGFCCICCEVLYLSLYLLHFPGFQRWPPAILVAVLAVPGFALKQFINCVQLWTAMQQLVATDRQKLTQEGRSARDKLDALSKVQ